MSRIYLKSKRDAFSGIVNNFMSGIEQPTKLGQANPCDVIACKDSQDSFIWKKKLIELAEHNIVISGNYCGGNSFDEILDLMKLQLEKKPGLKIVLLSSDKFINSSNQERIDELKRIYSDRFQLVETPDIWVVNPGLKKSTNHSKILAVDYGQYFVLGGSGIEDKYAYARGLGDRNIRQEAEVGGLMGMFLPRGFRDMDFVFQSSDPEGVGKRVYLESLKLALRWEGYQNKEELTSESVENALISSNSLAKQLLLQNSLEKIAEARDLAIENLQRPCFSLAEIKALTHVKSSSEYEGEFKDDSLDGEEIEVGDQADVKILCQGPEHESNAFEKEVIKQFAEAKERIVINHMYFHPSQKLFDELTKAVNRGVRLLIVTNGSESQSPAAHAIFGPRNKFNYAQLVLSVDESMRENIDVREFKVRKTTLHKKVIIVDDTVIAGSSNLGYKSLVTNSDHEINFVAKSKALAEKTLAITLVDGSDKHARKIKNPKNFSFGCRLRAIRHRLLAPLIG